MSLFSIVSLLIPGFFVTLACAEAIGHLNIESRIIGGQTAAAGQFPFVAYVLIETNNAKYHCAGTLLSNQWVVTTAHCAYLAQQVVVQLGSIYLNLPDPQRITVTSNDIHVHPDFHPASLESDIALIKFRQPIIESPYVKPIAFSAATDVVDLQVVTVLGWGAVEIEIGEQSEELQYVDLAIISQEECKKIYGNQITDTMLCAAANNHEGTCYGDMGGPLISRVGNTYNLVGIASFLSGNGCANTHPSGYTRVFKFTKWISEITGIASQ